MYIYDRQPSPLQSLRKELAPYTLGQSPASPAPYNTPGLPFDPQANYVLAPDVMNAVARLLSTPVPAGHLQTLGSGVDPLTVERGLTIYRYDDGRLHAGSVKFGASPRKERMSGSITSGRSIRYSVKIDVEPWTNIHATTGKVTEVPAWLFIHTHPSVQKFPGIPSGIRKENSILAGDLYSLRLEPDRQLGILTIGMNNVIANFQSAPQAIPFTLAIRDPIKGPTDYRETRILETHKAAATALRLMFRRPTVSGYFTGDLRTGTATPYLSERHHK